ncbi:MAG: RNA-binding protein [Bacteroidetes bacterium HGW-Bacteroidetes-17]|jgi:ribosome-associated protein|nr:MAG: RNA-binding protein [Bacteroidetes bacterium HGW-Bacteroidetes-17]
MKQKEEFVLSGHEFIELNKLLKFLGWVETGGEAKICIAEGDVKVNGETELRIRCKLRIGDKIQFREQEAVIN